MEHKETRATYTHSFTEKVKIPQPVSNDLLKNILTSPYYYELISYKSTLYYQRDSISRFPEDYFFKEGDEFISIVPTLEIKDEKHISKVTKIDFTDIRASITFEIRKAELKKSKETDMLEETGAAIVHTETTIYYQYNPIENELPTLGITMRIAPPHPSVVTILQTMYKQIGHRMQQLLSNPELCLKEFMLAGAIEIEKTDKANFYGNPYGINTALSIAYDSEELFKSFNTQGFVKKILYSSEEGEKINLQNSAEKSILNENDTFSVKLNNMEFSALSMKLKNIEEDVIFSVKKCEDGTIELLSQTGINNFYQFGISFNLENMHSSSVVRISLYYNLDRKLSVANTGYHLLSFMTEKIPDPKIFLFMRMRSMLDAITRHLYRYTTETFKDVEITPIADNSYIKSLQ